MLRGLENNNIWLGTEESTRAVVSLMEAQASGQLLQMMAENPDLQVMSRREDDEEYSIGSRLLAVDSGVAVITVSGSLVPAYAWYNEWFGVVSYEEIKDALHTAASDDNIKKILMVVDSGGGAVSGLDEMAQYISHINKYVKTVEGHTSSGAYSAGYWLLSATSKISAQRMAGTGSIGVIMTTVSYADALKAAGIKYTYIRSGEHKALGQIGEELSEEAIAELQDFVMQLHAFFEEHVVEARGYLAKNNKAQWNTGKTFLPEKSLSLGLIDEINTFKGHVAKLYENSNNVYLSTETGLSKEAIMKLKSLTKEQQARLAAGVPLASLGLSEKDLAAAELELASANDTDNTEVTSEENANGETVEAVEGDEEVTAEEEAADVEATETAKTLLAANAELNKQAARLEVKLEDATAQIDAASQEIETLKASQQNLATIVGEATNKLQVAIGASATSFDGLDAEAVLTQYTSAKEKFEATFKIGATSAAPVEDRDSQASLQPNNSIKKVK